MSAATQKYRESSHPLPVPSLSPPIKRGVNTAPSFQIISNHHNRDCVIKRNPQGKDRKEKIVRGLIK
jgi:hypothetical protein